MKEIIREGKVLARHIREEDMQENLNFFSQEQEYIQAGAWHYPKGKELLAHVHNQVERTITQTCEVLYVISGSLEAVIYDCSEKEAEKVCVKKGEILILINGGHGYHILEDHTKVLEVKNGPYVGADADRHRIEFK